MVSSYTANLAAFLTIETPVSLIESVDDLITNPLNIPFGAKKGGSTLSFFRDSSNPNYTKLYDIMTDPTKNFLTGSNDDGRDRARKERYAFFMESSTIEYTVERYCEVAQVGGKLDEKGYGIAMKKGLLIDIFRFSRMILYCSFREIPKFNSLRRTLII